MTKDQYGSPWQIGALNLESRVVAAPMAGVTDSAFRRILREQGAALTYTEMISAKGLYYKNENTKFLLAHQASEEPIFVQLFGSEPEILGSQAALIQQNFQGIDLNMGCPAPKIINNGEGSFLLQDPDRIYAIVRAVSRAVTVPVTVKLRKGFEAGDDQAVEAALACQEGGASAVTVHGRTAAQMYTGKADWDTVRRVKEALSIPVIGNGDVRDGASALAMLEQTGCDAVMVGRACMGDPWVFRNIADSLKAGEPIEKEKQSPEAIKAMIMRHARAVCEDKSEYVGIRQMRAHISWYVHGLSRPARRKLALEQLDSLEILEEVLQEL